MPSSTAFSKSFSKSSSNSLSNTHRFSSRSVLFFLGAFVVVSTSSVPVAHAYNLLGSEWDTEQGPVDFSLHEDGSDDINDGSDLEAVRLAFRAWSCTPGSRLRFIERTDVVVEKDGSLSNGVNAVFWDETGDFMLGPSTLGVNSGNGGGNQKRTASNIIFNGVDHTWSAGEDLSGVDVWSIAQHESGHWLGLGHPCTDAQETDCLGADVSVMTPAWSGGLDRGPKSDDIAGLLAMYPQDPGDNSTCDGPFRKGEVCACNDECASDLLCVEQPSGGSVCAGTCSSENLTGCGVGFNCVLSARPDDDESAPAMGMCQKVIDGTAKPAGAACVNDGFSCGQSDCVQSGAAGGARVCFKGCQTDDNCDDGYKCSGILCLLDTAELSIACPDPEPDDDDDDDDEDEDQGGGCACGAASVGETGLAAVLLLGVRWRRRRQLTR